MMRTGPSDDGDAGGCFLDCRWLIPIEAKPDGRARLVDRVALVSGRDEVGLADRPAEPKGKEAIGEQTAVPTTIVVEMRPIQREDRSRLPHTAGHANHMTATR